MEFRLSQIGDLDQIVRIAEDVKSFLRALRAAGMSGKCPAAPEGGI